MKKMLTATGVAAAVDVLGGFYTVQLDSSLRLIVINSNLWYYRDDKITDHTDPAGQFVWLENNLKDAQERSNLVSFCMPTTNMAA